MGTRLRWLALCLALAAPLPAAGQDAEEDPARLPRWEFGPYAGVSWHSPGPPRLGLIRDRNHVFVGAQLSANFVRTERWAFGYAPEILPVILLTNNPRYRTASFRSVRYTYEDGTGPVYGFGVAPIGLQAQLKVAPTWRLYVSGTGGVVWFTRDVPVLGARRFNYTFDVGGGVRWQVGERDALRLGYKFHHLSNAYTAWQNPGLDAMVFLAGYERAFGR